MNPVKYVDTIHLDAGTTIGDREVIADKVREYGEVLPTSTTKDIDFVVEAEDLWDLRELLDTIEQEVLPLAALGTTIEWDKTKVEDNSVLPVKGASKAKVEGES